MNSSAAGSGCIAFGIFLRNAGVWSLRHETLGGHCIRYSFAECGERPGISSCGGNKGRELGGSLFLYTFTVLLPDICVLNIRIIWVL